ncbi:MAG: hypothetical protein JXP34_00535 [Planctomycetes bacterium]|nr:hypothetical protein [Planctomycetota bacterium]
MESGATARVGSRIRRAVWIALALIAYAGLTYIPGAAWWAGWWISSAGALLIILFGRLAWPREWIDRLGLRLGLRGLAGTAVLCAASLLLFHSIVSVIVRSNALIWVPSSKIPGGRPYYVHTAAQVLNEELVLGALLLLSIRRRWPRPPASAIAFCVAAAFAAIHFAFYAWRPHADPNYGLLSPAALVALLLAGIVRNVLILRTGHIGYAWAIHFAWNVLFFCGYFLRQPEGTALSEPDRFNVILASPILFIPLVPAAVAALLLADRRRAGRCP